MNIRIEHDSIGDIEVPAEHYWGAQTQRSLQFFDISNERMPVELISALAEVKRASAVVNNELGLLEDLYSQSIITAADEILAGKFHYEFPLSVWQTGSGTQTNMNMNEVIANRAAEIIATQCGKKIKLHPNDHVNLGQSSNDIFPTAIHIAVANSSVKKLIPALSELIINLEEKSKQYSKLVKIGRTHLQDATPVTLGQEISGYIAQLRISEQAIKISLALIYELAIGGTAVGTGLNTHAEFGDRVAAELGIRYRLPFVSIKNKFAALAGHEALLISHGALKVLAATLLKIANDIRWLASGPRCGLGEITIPENEPGSSIMPGKVNPTQAEAMIMLSYQVIANDLAITMGGASGNFELNVNKPLIAYAHLQSLRLLADGMRSFNQHCIKGLVANEDHIHQSVDQSLMLVTALVPHIGYDKAAHIAKEAHTKGQDLRTTAAALGYVSKEDYDRWVNILNMTNSQ